MAEVGTGAGDKDVVTEAVRCGSVNNSAPEGRSHGFGTTAVIGAVVCARLERDADTSGV